MKEEEFYSPTLYAVSYMVRKLIFIRTSSLLLSLWTGQGRAHSPRSRLIGHSSMCALTAGSRRGADEFVCFHAMRVSPMRALEDGVGGTKPSATDEPSCMRAIMAVSSTTPRRSCRVSIQTNLVRIAHGCSCDDPRPWMAVRCTFSRTVSLACASTRSPQRADDRMTSMIRTSPTHRPEWSCREPPQTSSGSLIGASLTIQGRGWPSNAWSRGLCPWLAPVLARSDILKDELRSLSAL